MWERVQCTVCASCVQRDNNKRLSADRRESKNKKREKKKKKKKERRKMFAPSQSSSSSHPILFESHPLPASSFSLSHFLSNSLSYFLSLPFSLSLSLPFAYAGFLLRANKEHYYFIYFFFCVFSFVYLRRAVARHLNNRSINPPFFI